MHLEEKQDTTDVIKTPDRKSSIVLGILLILLALFVWWHTSSYPDSLLDARKMTGPGTFPRLLSMILGLIGAWEIRRAFRTGSWKISFPGMEAFCSHKNQNIWIVVVMTALFIPLTRYLGFSVGSIIYMSVLMARLKAKPWQAIITSLLAIVFVVVIFNYVFRVSLPVGILTEPHGWRY